LLNNVWVCRLAVVLLNRGVVLSPDNIRKAKRLADRAARKAAAAAAAAEVQSLSPVKSKKVNPFKGSTLAVQTPPKSTATDDGGHRKPNPFAGGGDGGGRKLNPFAKPGPHRGGELDDGGADAGAGAATALSARGPSAPRSLLPAKEPPSRKGSLQKWAQKGWLAWRSIALPPPLTPARACN
jgi:hypothetical protein